MKRIVSSVLLLLLALGAVFAGVSSEVHRLKMATIVRATVPAFQFEFTSGMKDTSTDIVTNAGAEAFGPGNYNEYGTNATAIEVADLSKQKLELVFTAILANNAKSLASYTLNFSAGAFDVYRNELPGLLEPSSAVVATASDLEGRKGVVAGTLNPAESIQLIFNGSNCEIGPLATFSVEYPADPSLDPSGEDGYFADIKLVISSDN